MNDFINWLWATLQKINAATWVAFIIGAGTIITNIIFSAKNNKTIKKLKVIELNANIIAASRIEWLHTVRSHTAEFIKNYYKHVNEIMYYEKIADQKEALANYNKSYWLLKLYYTPKDKDGKENKVHKEILMKLDTLNEELEAQIEFLKDDENYKIETEGLENHLKDFVNESAQHFKKVWEEAKTLEELKK